MPRDILNLLRNWKIIVPIVLVIVVISVGYVGFIYLERDPMFCASCHLMEEPFNKWQVSAMHSVPCIECHEQSVIDSVNILIKSFIINPENITVHARVDPETCLKCHGSGEKDYIQVLDESGHISHYVEGGIECTECHGVELHVFRPALQICSNCHLVEIKTGAMESHCLNCHQFSEEGVPLTPSRDECLSCHMDIVSVSPAYADAHEASDCVECHSPHEFPKIYSCNVCHSTGGIGLHDIPEHSQCEACHAPHSEDLEIRDICTSCHTDKASHMVGKPCTYCHGF